MAEIQGVSSATSPYEKATYSAKSNDKNTLSIESYFKLLSAQLANQDMTNPMDNSEMMAQMTQMAMVQSLGTMTTNMKQEMALTKTSYLAGLIGKDVSAKVPESELKANPNSPKEKSGVIASVNLTGDEPSFRLQGDITDYPLESLLMVRQAGAASATTAAGAAVTAPGASTGTATTAPGASTGTAATAPGASVAAPGTTGSPATAATAPGSSVAAPGTSGSPATAATAPGASTASTSPASGTTSPTAGFASAGSAASTENATTASAGSPAGASVPPAVAASSSPSSSEHGPHVAILEREAASPSANN